MFTLDGSSSIYDGKVDSVLDPFRLRRQQMSTGIEGILNKMCWGDVKKTKPSLWLYNKLVDNTSKLQYYSDGKLSRKLKSVAKTKKKQKSNRKARKGRKNMLLES